jgi:hypothetical protein
MERPVFRHPAGWCIPPLFLPGFRLEPRHPGLAWLVRHRWLQRPAYFFSELNDPLPAIFRFAKDFPYRGFPEGLNEPGLEQAGSSRVWSGQAGPGLVQREHRVAMQRIAGVIYGMRMGDAQELPVSYLSGAPPRPVLHNDLEPCPFSGFTGLRDCNARDRKNLPDKTAGNAGVGIKYHGIPCRVRDPAPWRAG